MDRASRWRHGCRRVLRALAGFLVACAAIAAPASAPPSSPAAVPALEYFASGDVASTTARTTSPGLLLMGGGREIPAAFAWFAAQAGHGHIVILRASGDDELQRWIFGDVGGVASAETLVFHARAAAFDPRVQEIIRRADGIFIAGGDQANYVRYWKDTPLAALLDAHVAAGKPLGGTSAGLAILGEWGYGALDGGSVTSKQALADPAGPALTLVHGFLSLPRLEGAITDTHFAQRKRLGRLLAMVARISRDAPGQTVKGLGVDEDSALLVEADGSARLASWHADGHAWIVAPAAPGARDGSSGGPAADASAAGPMQAGKPLDGAAFQVTGVGLRSRLRLPGYDVDAPAFRLRVDVRRGIPAVRVLSGTAPGEVIE